MKDFLRKLLQKITGSDVGDLNEMDEDFADRLVNVFVEPSRKSWRDNLINQAVAEGALSENEREYIREKFSGEPVAVVSSFLATLKERPELRPEWMRRIAPLSSVQEHMNKQVGLDRQTFEKYNHFNPARRD